MKGHINKRVSLCVCVRMERHEVLHAMLVSGKNYSLGVHDLRALLLKLTVLSAKYISRRALWAQLFGEDYVDWDLVEASAKNIVGGCPEWLGLLAFCRWDELGKHEIPAPLQALRKNMQACGLDLGGGVAWTLVCKAQLLLLLQGVPASHALEVLTCGVFKRNTQAGCTQLLARQAELLYTPAQCEATLLFMLRHCEVDSAALEQTQQLVQASADDRKLCLKMSRMTVIQGRPRLRDRVTSVLKTEERKAQVDTQLETWESYTGYTYKMHFPPTLSEKVRSKLYFLASQTRWNWQKYVEAVLPGGGALCQRVAEHPITQPDLPVLLRVIEGLSMDGSPPFQAMTDFRKECFGSFPVTHVQRMTLSQILQLYVAAYQNQEIWKSLWRDVVGVISVHIIRDIELFVAKNPFADAEVMRFVAAS